jgi:NAD(P)-dependent dehydrogenase (short-subunit alcohol dehydrogenase family)
MSNQFFEKVCLVTGAGSGIGRETAFAFAREGGKVIVADINKETGGETKSAIIEAGGDSFFVQVDISNCEDVAEMIKATVEQYGRLDCAVNCAGIIGGHMPFTETPDELWHKILSVNLTGVWNCLKQEIDQLRKQGGGSIVNVASVAGLKGLANGSAYSAAKHGVIGLTKSIALENATNNIRINAVCPSYVETPFILDGELNARNNSKIFSRISRMQPIGRMGQPEEIAEAILWLCSDKTSFVTGTALSIDGGVTAG